MVHDRAGNRAQRETSPKSSSVGPHYDQVGAPSLGLFKNNLCRPSETPARLDMIRGVRETGLNDLCGLIYVRLRVLLCEFVETFIRIGRDSKWLSGHRHLKLECGNNPYSISVGQI